LRAVVKPKSRKRAKPAPERVSAELVPAARGPGTALTRVEPTARRRGIRLLQTFFEKRSELTVKNYRVDLVHFSRWWHAGGHDLDARQGTKRKAHRLDLDAVAIPEELAARDAFVADVLREFHGLDQLEALATALAYQQDLKSGALGRTFAPQTINHRITALRSVTDMARLLGMCSFDLAAVDLMETTRSRDTEGCGEAGVDKLVLQAEMDVEDAVTAVARLRATRNAVIVHLMHDCGLRRFEAIQPLWPDDVDLAGGRIRFRGKKRAAKEWFPVLNKDSKVAIGRHLQHRGSTPGYLVYGKVPTRSLDNSAVNRMLEDLAKRAGIEVTPHGLRHTAATTLLEQTNGNVRAVAAFLRHKTTATVQVYDDDRKKLPQQMSGLLDRKKKT